MQIGVITNPNSRKNRGRPNRAAKLQSIVGELGEVHQTDSVDSIKPVLREFLRKRARYWVADGGDGALHWMIRMGLEVLQEDEFRGGDAALPVTMPTNGGTIDFVANNVGIKGDAEGLLESLRGTIETGRTVKEVEVDAMLVEGVQVLDDGTEERFRTYGFACAAGGVGQRFYSLYYDHPDPNARTIVKIIAGAVAAMPLALTPLRQLPGARNAGRYAATMFKPTCARVTMDGMELPDTRCTGIHVASMSINLGNLFRFFGKAEQPGLLHALVGSPSPLGIVRNIPNMHLGREIRHKKVVDRACRELLIEAAGDELLAPVIDGEYYRNLKSVRFSVGPRLRIPKVVSRRPYRA